MLRVNPWEATLKRYGTTIAFGFLLVLCGLFVTACGNSEVRNQKAPETVLNPDATPTDQPTPEAIAVVTPQAEQPVRIHHHYVAKALPVAVTPTPTVVAAQVQATPTVVPTPIVSQPMPPVETTVAPKPKRGTNWLLWILILIILIVAGVWGYFRYLEMKEDSHQPQPPVGGLSPVSGFTGQKHLRKAKKPRFWNRKLF
jgi:hypothetical protein